MEVTARQRIGKRQVYLNVELYDSNLPAVVKQKPVRTLHASLGDIRRWLKQLDPFVIYAIGAAVFFLLVFFVTAGVSSLTMNTGTTFERMPKDSSIDSLLIDYLGTNSGVSTGSSDSMQIPVQKITPAVSAKSYTVQKGDSVSSIARKNGLKVSTIVSYNGIKDVYRLRAGMKLQIPDMDGIVYDVQRGDTLSGISQRFNVALNPILDANDLHSSVITPGQVLFLPHATMNEVNLRMAMGTLFTYPVRGPLTSPFGMRTDPFTGVMSMHNGIDLAVPVGTPVKAANRGTVNMIGQNSIYGNYVIIAHSGGFQTLYAHLSAWKVKRNQVVTQGQIIALSGSTGESTGPHLHFSVYKDGRPVNPLLYLH